MSSAFLQWTDSVGKEYSYVLPAGEALIGRKTDAQIVLSSPYVSRHHAKVLREGDDFLLVDLNSTHGTFVNGQRVQRHRLQHGDTFSLGKDAMETFVFQSGPGAAQTLSAEGTLDPPEAFRDLTSILPAQYSDLEKISFILDFQFHLGQHFSPDKTFQQILNSALNISRAERGFILLKEKDGFEYVVGLDGHGRILSQTDFRTSQTVVRQVAEAGEPVFMTEGIDDRFARQESIVAMNIRAVACLPLKWISPQSSGLEVRGILYLDSTRIMHSLSGLDQKIFNKLALEAANVFEKVEMIKSFEERRRLEQELALAWETQKSLLPATLPELKGYRFFAFSKPTRYVGGDFYDFLNLGSDRLWAVLADVSGKGIAAALLSSLVQGALDIESHAGSSPEQTLTRLNRLLCRRSSANRFVTLLFLHLDLKGQGSYISAGHNPAYLFRARKGDIEELPSTDLILGAFPHVTYKSAPLVFEPGDILVSYSDGVTEAQNPAQDMFGEPRLQEIIRHWGTQGGAVLEKRILEAIEDFTQGETQSDDITILLVEREVLA